MSYSPPTATLGNTDWPTLSTMIDAGTRLVTFLDAGANFDEVPYLIDGMWYILMWIPVSLMSLGI
jgi:hypothetical protein